MIVDELLCIYDILEKQMWSYTVCPNKLRTLYILLKFQY